MLSTDDYERGKAKTRYNITQISERLPEKGNKVVVEVSNLNTEPDSPTPPQHKILSEVQKILFLAATPEDQVILNMGRELNKIEQALSLSTYRGKFKLETKTAVKVPDITQAMQVHRPQIVHFSGHGSGELGLVVEDDAGQSRFFPTTGLDRLFRLFKNNVKCVVLSACYSADQAEVISKHGMYVIGMNNSVSDTAAIDFATGFYQSLGEGYDYEFAFEIALVNTSPNLEDADYPELWHNGKKLDL